LIILTVKEEQMALNLKIAGAAEGLKLSDILPGELEYGMYDDAYRLQETDSQTAAIVFDPKHIERGINLEIKPEGVEIGLSMPSGKDDIELAYRLARRACRKLGAGSVDINGKDAELGALEAREEQSCSESADMLAEMLEKLRAEKGKVVTMFGALNPITLSADDLEKMDGKIEKLGKFLHNKQTVNAMYSAPQFFQDPETGSFMGVYSIMNDMDTIMPFEPSTPFYMEGDPDGWFVYIYISDTQYGYVKFEDFFNKAPRNGLYDATHFFCNLSEEQADQLIKNYGIEM